MYQTTNAGWRWYEIIIIIIIIRGSIWQDSTVMLDTGKKWNIEFRGFASLGPPNTHHWKVIERSQHQDNWPSNFRGIKWDQLDQVEKVMIPWIYPPPRIASDHQDYEPFSVGILINLHLWLASWVGGRPKFHHYSFQNKHTMHVNTESNHRIWWSIINQQPESLCHLSWLFWPSIFTI